MSIVRKLFAIVGFEKLNSTRA